MRPSIRVLVALNFSLAATAGACDDTAAEALADLPDDPVSFRDDDCVPPHCLNSPYVGDYPFSNIRTKQNAAAPVPFVSSTSSSYWGTGYHLDATSTWMSFDYLIPMEEGRLFAWDSVSKRLEPLDEGIQTLLMLTITDPTASPSTRQVPLWIKSAEVAPSATAANFDVWKYTIAAKAAPPTSDYPSEGTPPVVISAIWNGEYFSICPVTDEESGQALVLQYVELNADGPAAWLEDGVGLGPYHSDGPSTLVLACQGQAFSKPLEFLAVTPNVYLVASQPGTRNYGLPGYNALANAYRAFYAGAPRTELGTPVHFKDFAHNPPWFDQTTSAHLPPPPILGHWQFVLESVYKDVDGNGDPLGANCYYTDTIAPNGVHRLYNPPGGNPNLPGWSNMTSCGATQSSWEGFGPVGAFVPKHVLPGGGSGS